MLLQLFVEPKVITVADGIIRDIVMSQNSRYSAVYIYTKKASLVTLVWLDPFLVQGIYLLQCKYLAKPLSIWSYMLHSYLYDVLNYLAGPQLHMNVAYYVTDS